MRETCVSCGRPQRVCLCAVLPKQPLTTSTRIIVLQHPHETRHKLATVSVVARCLINCQVFVGRRFRHGTCSVLDECALNASSSSASAASAEGPQTGNTGRCGNCGEKKIVLLLFPTSTATDLSTWCQSSLRINCSSSSNSERVTDSRSAGSDGDGGISTALLNTSASLGTTSEEAELTNFFDNSRLTSGSQSRETKGSEDVMDDRSDEKCLEGHVILLVVDGTWQHAKEMVKASMPFLDDFVTLVSLPHDIQREGSGMGDSDSILRKEPFAGCVSTIEAVARALAILEPNGTHIVTTLLGVLQRMVKLQTSHFTPLKPRPRLTKKCGRKEANQPELLAGEYRT